MDNLELHGDVEACMMGVMSANQNYDTTADQNYDTTADQNYDTTANQNDDSDDTTVGQNYDTAADRAQGLFPLQRMALPPEKPTGRKLEEVKSALFGCIVLQAIAAWRPMEALARLLEKRGAARWASDLARELRCADCDESRRITPAPPASTDEPPMLREYLGMDVFDCEFERDGSRMKAKFLLMQDRASRHCMVKHLKDYPATENWEPSSAEVRSAVVTGWMAVNPAPTWIIADSAPYFSSSEFSDCCSRSGMGLLLAPAEAHWLLGHEERKIQVLKRTSARLEKEGLDFSIQEIFALAAHGANSAVNSTGFSPFQWSRGWQKDEVESLPEGKSLCQDAGNAGKGSGRFREGRCCREAVAAQQRCAKKGRTVPSGRSRDALEAADTPGQRWMDRPPSGADGSELPGSCPSRPRR